MKKQEKGRGGVFPFEKLEVWQLSVDLADYISELTQLFLPKAKRSSSAAEGSTLLNPP
jgi:hypothetical protein